MRVTDCTHIAGMTLLGLSGEIPKGPWQYVIIDGKSFEPLVPMYAGDVSHTENSSIGVRGEHDLEGKSVEFI